MFPGLKVEVIGICDTPDWEMQFRSPCRLLAGIILCCNVRFYKDSVFEKSELLYFGTLFISLCGACSVHWPCSIMFVL